ncbi:MAG TPA: PEP-CTERM sorting domain-containing protein [Phycisphaerales bacterium]|nr:PEP-CTERM sorting domain-containing protein [Phycisphaerales bacterium]
MARGIRMNRAQLLLTAGAAALLGGTGSASAVGVSLYGDLGQPPGWSTQNIAWINTTDALHFSHALPGIGVVSGDAITTNTNGTQFDLVLTNFDFTSTSPTGALFIKLQVYNYFELATSPMTFNATHSANGTWNVGEHSVIRFDSRQDFGGSDVHLPPLIADNLHQFSGFSIGPESATVTTTMPNVMFMISEIQMFIDGTGSIIMPSSYDVNATAVPAPGALALTGLAGAGALRRRRRSS